MDSRKFASSLHSDSSAWPSCPGIRTLECGPIGVDVGDKLPKFGGLEPVQLLSSHRSLHDSDCKELFATETVEFEPVRLDLERDRV